MMFYRTDKNKIMISLNKFKGIEVISNILSKHNSVKPEINYRKKK